MPADDIGESSSKNSTTGIADRQYDDGEEGKLAERSPTEVLRNTDESQPGRSAGKKNDPEDVKLGAAKHVLPGRIGA